MVFYRSQQPLRWSRAGSSHSVQNRFLTIDVDAIPRVPVSRCWHACRRGIRRADRKIAVFWQSALQTLRGRVILIQIRIWPTRLVSMRRFTSTGCDVSARHASRRGFQSCESNLVARPDVMVPLSIVGRTNSLSPLFSGTGGFR